MRAAIFGGTFNPIHRGHLFVADIVRNLLDYDHVIFVPSNRPAHKEVAEGVSAEHRLKMVRLAVRWQRGFVADSCEIRRGGTSYTTETVAELTDKYRLEGKPAVVIGDDLIAGFHSWREAGRLAHETEIVVFHRNSTGRLPFDLPHRYLDNQCVQVSSTQIRDRVRRGLPIGHLVPEAVRRYIARHHLYAAELAGYE